jgi:RimJ/RimL family protein N-acetyltransferase
MPTLFPTHVESERLRYEPLHESIDALDLYEYHRSGEMDAVMQALGDETHATPKETADELTESGETWESADRATYAMRRTADDEFVGVAELWFEWDKHKVSFGTWVREPYWGQGYSTERAGTMLYIVFELLDLDLVSVGHEPENEQSKRAIEKYVDAYGGQRDGLLRNELPPSDFGGPRDLVVYTILQDQWREHVTDDELETIRVSR